MFLLFLRLLLFFCLVTLFSVNGLADEVRLAPGDDKRGYESTAYTTNSLSLEQRKGRVADLFGFATQSQLGLPDLSQYQELKPDAQKIALGKRLFYDRRLSRNGTMSCAMCHIPEQGFTSNELKRPIGFEGRAVRRNAPSLLNVRFYRQLFVDARESTLSQQVWAPLLAHNEMNNPSVGFVIDLIQADADYLKQFEMAFGSKANMISIGQALAQYQQALVSAESPFDKWKYGGVESALSEEQKAGYGLFVGKAKCASCHSVGKEFALFTDQELHNTGVGYRYSMRATPDTITVTLAPGVTTQLDSLKVKTVGEPKENDLGRYEVSLDPDDRWRYRTPTLRNIALTAPYMHNGEFLTLEEVVEYYDQGGTSHELQSKQIVPLQLTVTEKTALTEFLRSLTGSKTRLLVADAHAAAIGDAR